MTRCSLVVTTLVIGSMNAAAQQSARTAVSTTSANVHPAACPAPRALAEPNADQRRAARQLAERAQQAAILGDRAAEREQLRQAAALDPRDADLAYQLARANDAGGAAAEAAAEYCRYLSLAPNGPESAEVRERVAALAPPPRVTVPLADPFSPSRALTLGLVIPGAGQFYTGRPVAGALALGSAAAGVACGLSQRTTFTSVQESALDPFGNPYTYTARRPVSSRPCLVPGLALAGVIGVSSAIEAYNHARHANDDRRLAIDLVPDGTTLALRVIVR